MSAARKTYWHLAAARRIPSDYEIATSRLLYHLDRGGFAVELPTSDFHRRFQNGSPLASDRWDEFADPRATTYTKYVDLQRERESYVGRLLASLEDGDADARLDAGWVRALGGVLSPLRYLCHGLQMAAAAVGHTAPSGRIAVAALFQCGDELRRIQRFAQRLALCARVRPGIAEAGRARWQEAAPWQPLRRVIEKLLVTYDWGEGLVALNLCIKPVVDDLFLRQLGARAEAAGDHLDAQLLRALDEDCAWHRQWTEALLAFAFTDRPANQEVVARWIEAWRPLADEAGRAAAPLLEEPEGG